MDHRSAVGQERFPIGALLVFLLVLAGCKRSERAAPASAGHQQPASSLARSGALGFDSVVKRQRPGSTCYASARYVVIERDLEDQVGSDLYVRPRGVPDAPLRCDGDSIAGDIVFRTGEAASRHPDAQHFLGLKGDLLVAWDGTGGASDLYIYDLTKRAKALVVEGVHDDELTWEFPMTVTLWVTKAYAERAAAAGCRDTMPANPAELDSLMSLDLVRLSLRPTGRYRCVVGQ